MDTLDRERELDRRRWVEPDLPEARIDEGWAAISERTRKPSSRARVWVPVAGLAAAAAVLFVWLGRGEDASDRSAWVGTALRTGNEPMQVELADGSAIDAEPRSQLALLEGTERSVRIALREGAASFDVTRNPERAFVVEADDVSVRVIGTSFTVRRAVVDGATVVEVDVARGRVEVRAGDELSVLGAGDTWRRRRAETVEVSQAEPVVSEVVEDGEPDRRRARRARRAADRGPDPSELFENARAARRSGDAREAAEIYARLVRDHRGDARAPLAALELGRLRMDALGDPRGAIEALETAIALSPRGPFREDAMARIVRAQDALGARAACGRARDAYLARYPEGRWATDVERRCE